MMQVAGKIARWFLILCGGVLLILMILPFLLGNNIGSLLVKTINNRVSTQIDVSSASLSFLRRFPKASVQLYDFTVFSSPDFSKNQFAGNSDTLIYAGSASFEFSMTNLLTRNYTVESILLSDGFIQLFSDSAGRVNYQVTTSPEGSQSELNLDIEKITLANMRASYSDSYVNLHISGLFRNGSLRSRMAGENIDFYCTSEIELMKFYLDSARIDTRLEGSVDLSLHKSDSGIFFRKGRLEVEKIAFDISGMIGNDNYYDLDISGNNIDLGKAGSFLHKEYSGRLKDYGVTGNVNARCKINGISDREKNPAVTASFSLQNGSVIYRKSDFRVRNISLKGSFSNGRSKSSATSVLNLDSFRADAGSAVWTGNMMLRNFDRPEVRLIFTGDLIPAELIRFVEIPGIADAEGSARINLSLAGSVRSLTAISFANLAALNPRADISFSSFGFAYDKYKVKLKDVDGNAMLAKSLWIDDLSFYFNNQRFRLSGEFNSFPEWLSGRNTKLKCRADLWVENINELLWSSFNREEETNPARAIELPGGIEMDLALRADNFEHKNFKASEIAGKLEYRPGYLNIKSFTMNSMGGAISGSCAVFQNRNKSFFTRGDLELKSIDINKAFISFNNFGQDFIKAENLKGSLSGNLSLILPMDSLLRPDTKAMIADGKYVITDGSLINFEPVKELSDFIELSELETITFSKLENELFIRNNYLAVPQMEIKSSAADFSVSGKHDFDNNYEYHVRTYLSEILSKKAMKESRANTDFGAVEDDGLGRTSIFLKITGNDEDIKVTYDMKAATTRVKESLDNEKKTMKSILNEEYGMFGRDSTVTRKPDSKPKYRIEWSETDTSGTKVDTVADEKNKFLNRLFKKKKI